MSPILSHRRCKLWLGDCRGVLPTLADRSVDCVITDPPYPCMSRDYGNMTEKAWRSMMETVVGECRRVLTRRGSAVFILQANSERVGRMRPWLWEFQAWLCREWNIVQDVYWWNFTTPPTVHCQQSVGLTRPSVKTCVWCGPANCHKDQGAVLWEESQANVAMRLSQRANPKPDYRNPSGHHGNKLNTTLAAENRGGSTPFNLLPIGNTNSRDSGGAHGHGAATPYALCDWWVRYITPMNGLVLDPFAGSATVGRAALDRGCRFWGVEQGVAHAATARNLLRRHLD